MGANLKTHTPMSPFIRRSSNSSPTHQCSLSTPKLLRGRKETRMLLTIDLSETWKKNHLLKVIKKDEDRVWNRELKPPNP